MDRFITERPCFLGLIFCLSYIVCSYGNASGKSYLKDRAHFDSLGAQSILAGRQKGFEVRKKKGRNASALLVSPLYTVWDPSLWDDADLI